MRWRGPVPCSRSSGLNFTISALNARGNVLVDASEAALISAGGAAAQYCTRNTHVLMAAVLPTSRSPKSAGS